MHLCDKYQQELCPLPQPIADKSALQSPIHIACSVCTTYVISAFQRLYESPDKYFFHIKKGWCPSIFLLFLPFYTSLFTLIFGELSVFYLSGLHLWFLHWGDLYPSLSILSSIRNFKFLECALHNFFAKELSILVSILGDIHLFNSPEKQVIIKEKALLELTGDWVSVTFASVVLF